MNLGRLNHIGVATPSIERSVGMYRDLLGATEIGEAFDLPAQKVRVCFVDLPNSQIELLEPLGRLADREVPGEEPGGRAASSLLRSAGHPRRRGRDEGARRDSAGRAADRGAWHSGPVPASQGHRRRSCELMETPTDGH
jgi:catechol 2,3-dioxygenase-like lactoylglutathione lyase family enzyme